VIGVVNSCTGQQQPAQEDPTIVPVNVFWESALCNPGTISSQRRSELISHIIGNGSNLVYQSS
jgi:hypothetical protein